MQGTAGTPSRDGRLDPPEWEERLTTLGFTLNAKELFKQLGKPGQQHAAAPATVLLSLRVSLGSGLRGLRHQ